MTAVGVTDEMIDAFQDAWAAHNNVHRVGDEHGELLSDGTCCDRAGLAAVVPEIRETAYRAGREDAARALEARIVSGLALPPECVRPDGYLAAGPFRAWVAGIARGDL